MLYARMEEVSFRSGAAVAGGVLTAAGVAITLAVVLGGHSEAAASAPASRVAVPSVTLPSPAPVSSSSSPPPNPRPRRTTDPAAAAGAYQPPSAIRASATRHPAAPAPGSTPTPRLRDPRSPASPGLPPGGWGNEPPPPWPWPFGLLRHHRRRPLRGRHETGHSVRLNAIDSGFHGVPAEPGHANSGADGDSVNRVRFRGWGTRSATINLAGIEPWRHGCGNYAVNPRHQWCHSDRSDSCDCESRRRMNLPLDPALGG